MQMIPDHTTPSSGSPAKTNRFQRFQIAIVGLLTLALTLRLLAFVDRYTVNMLFRDQFDFLAGFFDGAGFDRANIWTRFAWQHGPHRQGLGAILLTIIYELSNWNTRVEGWATAGILIVTCLMALWLKYRITRQVVWSDAVIPLIFLTLFQYEQFALTQNPSHGPIPGMIVKGVALALLIPRAAVRGLVLVMLCFVSMYTGFAFFLGVLIPGLLLLDLVKNWQHRGERTVHLISLIAALMAAGSFLIHYKHQPAIDCYKFPHDRPVEYVAFASVMFGRAVGAMQAFAHDGIIRIGVSILAYGTLWLTALVAASKIIRADSKVSDKVILLLASFPLLYGISAAIGRVCAGMASALSSRYVAYSLPGYLAIYLALITWVRPSKLRTLVLGALVLLLTFKETLVPLDAPDYEKLAQGKRQWIACYVETGDIKGCEEKAGIMVYPQPEATRMREKLEYLRERGASFWGG